MKQLLLPLIASIMLAASTAGGRAQSEAHKIKSLRITILSTMLADQGLGEWGFAALVEADGRKILFDTGARPETVLRNAKEMGVDLSTVEEVFLSHNHSDHTGGLLTLRREMAKQNPAALSRVHVGRGLFYSRPSKDGEGNSMIAGKAAFEATGGGFIEHEKAKTLFPGVWLTGPVPRVFPERNWSGAGRVKAPEGVVEDTLPEDMSMVFDTEKGLVVLSGCGHAGVINTMTLIREARKDQPIFAAIGGFHLFPLADEKLDWTAGKLRDFGLKQFLGAHCTGVEAVYYLRRAIGLDRKSCVVGAVGASFSLDKGIDPLSVAR